MSEVEFHDVSGDDQFGGDDLRHTPIHTKYRSLSPNPLESELRVGPHDVRDVNGRVEVLALRRVEDRTSRLILGLVL
jgi:hypothetical protein